ncbi:hypothetical protein GCM10010052_34840 [Paenarthrobacter histidinolovorans]|nr:hypothetical protein GCM10010052_34840 [Paenarthrobacter histidinolovorans]
MFGTGGGVSNTGSTAVGPPSVTGSRGGGGACGAGAAGLEDPSTAGVATAGAGAAVGLSSGADKPEGTLDDAVVLAPGTASVAGRSWLEAAMQRASAPASTTAAGAASLFTITPRMLVAPKYGRGFTCPGTIVP